MQVRGTHRRAQGTSAPSGPAEPGGGGSEQDFGRQSQGRRRDAPHIYCNRSSGRQPLRRVDERAPRTRWSQGDAYAQAETVGAQVERKQRPRAARGGSQDLQYAQERVANDSHRLDLLPEQAVCEGREKTNAGKDKPPNLTRYFVERAKLPSKRFPPLEPSSK